MIFIRRSYCKSKSGFQIATGIDKCDSCDKCPMKEKRVKADGGRKPLKERRKVLYVSKHLLPQREAMEEKITSPEGNLLRVNRSIQAEDGPRNFPTGLESNAVLFMEI